MKLQENTKGLIELHRTPRSHDVMRALGAFAHRTAVKTADVAAVVYTRLQKPQELDRSMYYEPLQPTGDVHKVGPQKVKKFQKQYPQMGKVITPPQEVWTQNTESIVTVYDWANDPEAVKELSTAHTLDMDEATPADVSFKADTPVKRVETPVEAHIRSMALNDLSPSEREIIEQSLSH